jgi:uncharacterized protein
MPVQPTFPGVYVQEVPSGVRTITGVSTSVAAFVGMVNRGPLGLPVRILSFADYERRFGNDTSASEMTDQVRQFFLNGGQQAFIMRIAQDAVAAAVTLRSESEKAVEKDVLVLTAKDAGTVGDAIRIEIDYDTSSPESTFNLTAYRLVSDGQGGTERVEEEVHSELSMNPNSPRFAVAVLSQQSNLLNAAPPGGDVNNVSALTAFAFPGYAVAGLIASVAEFQAAITSAIPVGQFGSFLISVDGSPYVPVSVDRAAISANLIEGLNTAISNALLNFSVSATALTLENHLIIRSSAKGGSVRLRPGTTNDLSAALLLGLDRGGLEVDGYAEARPAPNGIFNTLGALPDDVPADWLKALRELGTKEVANVTGYSLIDVTGTYTQTANFSFAGGTLMANAAGTQNSLAQLQQSLDVIANQINLDAANNDQFGWEAERVGFRIVLKPTFGSSDTLADSFDITPDAAGEFKLNVPAYRMNRTGEFQFQVGGTPGDDGLAPGVDEYDDAYVTIDREVDLFNLMILPRATGQDDDAMAELYGSASVFCQERRAFLIVDPRSDWITVDDVDEEIVDVRIGLATDHAAVYWPRLAISEAGVIRHIDPSGSIAGLMARIDSSRGVWKAPAGTEATIRGVRGVQHSMSDGENGLINPQAVNALRVFPAGVVCWGARTMVGFNNSGNDDYKYVPVRRLALFMEESLYRGLQFAVFEPNDEPLWAQIRLAAGAFMNNLFRQGAFQGQKASDAYFVKVDAETTTQNDINLGIVNVVIGFAPLKPAEFVIITIQQRAGQVNV